MDLALNYLQWLICHKKTKKQINPSATSRMRHKVIFELGTAGLNSVFHMLDWLP